jgi:hypothetical protein
MKVRMLHFSCPVSRHPSLQARQPLPLQNPPGFFEKCADRFPSRSRCLLKIGAMGAFERPVPEFARLALNPT